MDRRGFFEQIFGRWVRPAAEYTSDLLASHLPTERRLLRPPGALPERDLLRACFHSGNCVDSCPAEAIQTYLGPDEMLTGTPFIDPDKQPCVVCNSLACMAACPSGALRSVPREQIAMGRAVWSIEVCFRSRNDACQKCVDRCPLGESAIQLGSESQIQILQGCVGCGICQHVCPVNAIRVEPV